ncbi:pseudouridine synthase [Synergistales bacterium]|nr:pseudouridine synthase [Synergistales bacterium]
MYELTINDDMAGHRLDFAVSREFGLSRAYSLSLIKGGNVTARTGRRLKPSVKVLAGERYGVDLPPPRKLGLEPEDVDFGVVYSDEDVIVVNKPAGLVVHPAPGHWRGTLVHGLLYRFPELGNLNGVERPGIVHRLDATTSGLMVVARSGLAQEKLWSAFKERRVGKEYLALCFGAPLRKSALIDMPIGRDPLHRRRMSVNSEGRGAVTEYEVLWSGKGYSFIKCRLRTGRTHQIRVHMSAVGCPLVGDTVYSNRPSPFDAPRVFLHSWRLSFNHPRSDERMEFRAVLPDDLTGFLRAE